MDQVCSKFVIMDFLQQSKIGQKLKYPYRVKTFHSLKKLPFQRREVTVALNHRDRDHEVASRKQNRYI